MIGLNILMKLSINFKIFLKNMVFYHKYFFMYKFYYLASCILLFSCSSNKDAYVELETKRSDRKLDYKIEEYVIGQNSVDSLYYKDFSIYENKKGESYLLLANSLNQYLEVYNLLSKERVLKLPYDKFIAINDFGEINSVYMHNFDSIFVIQENLITLMDSTKVLDTMSINIIVADKMPLYYLKNLENTPLFYDTQKDKLIVSVYCSGCYLHKKKYYHSPLEALIDLKEKDITYLPVTYPKKYQENYYGFALTVNKDVYKNLSIFSFEVDPNIYVYDRHKDSLMVKGGRSSYQEKNAEVLNKKYKNNSEEKLTHLRLCPIYSRILYDSYRDLYYRFFFKEVPLKNEDGLYTIWKDKEFILMIFDGDFNLLEEIRLNKGDKRYYSHRSFVTAKGLFLPRIDNKDKYSLRFDIFDFH